MVKNLSLDHSLITNWICELRDVEIKRTGRGLEKIWKESQAFVLTKSAKPYPGLKKK
jgi:hypothetical protein